MRCRLPLALGLYLWATLAHAALSVDGTGSGNSSASTTCSFTGTALTQANANDIILVFVAANRTNAQGTVPSVSTVASTTPNLTFTKRSAYSYHSSGTGTDFIDIELWWALSPSASTFNAGNGFLVTFAATIDNCALIGIGVTGANTGAPFDTATSSGYTNSGTNSAGAPSVTGVTTNCDKTLVFQGAAFWNGAGAAPPDNTAGTIGGTGANLITNVLAQSGSDDGKSTAQQLIVAATQSSATDVFGTSWVGNISLADAVRDSTASCGGGGGGSTPRTLDLLGVGR